MGIFRRSDKPNVKKRAKQKDAKGLAEALKHEDEKVRKEAHQALLKMLTLEKYEDINAKYEAARALRKSGHPTFESLKIEFDSTDWDHFLGAIEGLTELGKQGDVRPIEMFRLRTSHHYFDKDSLRIPALPRIINALQEIEKSLIELLKTGNTEEQGKAVLGLGKIAEHGVDCFFLNYDEFSIAPVESLRDKAINALTESLSNQNSSLNEAAKSELKKIRDSWSEAYEKYASLSKYYKKPIIKI